MAESRISGSRKVSGRRSDSTRLSMVKKKKRRSRKAKPAAQPPSPPPADPAP